MPEPIQFLRLPLVRQGSNYTCGVSAVQSVLGYFGIQSREDRLITVLNCQPSNGTPSWNIESYLIEQGFEVSRQFQQTVTQLCEALDKGIPIIVAIQAWKDDDRDYVDCWDSGHYVVVIGYDEDNLYFMDPSTLGSYTYIPISEFELRWHDIDQRGDPAIGLAIYVSNPGSFTMTKKDDFVYLG